MNDKQFKLWNQIAAGVAFLVALITYTLTLEPTASFWDCGEFIASSYKLEVGHPPGNPVFQLIARFFTMFTGAESAAVAVNFLSGVCSALTIYFLYLTVVFFAKRLFRAREDGSYDLGSALAIIGSGLVGGLAYAFSDTFWFSAVEAEVYAMSSLFTALVFWAMTRWYEDADQPHADRWIVLVFFLMGLSIGIHLLNLLALPALIFLYAYRKRGERPFNLLQLTGIMAASVVLLGFLVFIFIPYLPKTAAFFDLVFVNSLGLPYNSGAFFFIALLLALCFALLFLSQKRKAYYLNLATLCFTTLVIGFSIFSVVIIRSSVKTPTNEYQPDNPYTLVRYLSREQYGSAPLIFGEYFGSDIDRDQPFLHDSYHAPLGGRYEEVEAPTEYNYPLSEKMLFPRMWSPYGTHPQYYVDNYVPECLSYDEYGRKQYTKPSQLKNLHFFFDYQCNWMYWRYFFWNFVGRQNDVHGQQPQALYGNWESGISALDDWMLGDGDSLPGILKDNKGKNHYYFLPLLLGLLGLCYQAVRDRRGIWLVFLMFFMTGIAIVLYLNQPPMQVRERDYAYAGSFYFYAVWIGLGVTALAGTALELVRTRRAWIFSAGASLLCLGVPVLMGAENWDDHDRSNRYTAVEMARNYLNSVGPDGLLVTHGDNDTFPLWYAQEVESVRTDVRILNTSLLGTDWHIDQMRWAVNESAPLKLTIPHEQYLYGRNESLLVAPRDWEIFEKRGDKYVRVGFDPGAEVPVADAIATFITQPQYYYSPFGNQDYEPVSVFPYKKVTVPVNVGNALRCGILTPELVDEACGDGDGTMTPEELDRVPKEISLTIPSSTMSKPVLFLLDLLAGYEWDRPLNMLPYGSDFNAGQDDYMMYAGFSSVLVPLKKSQYENTKAYANGLYRKIFPPEDNPMAVSRAFRWDAIGRTDYYADYQNHYTFLASSNQRLFFYTVAKALYAAGEYGKAVDVLDKCVESIPQSQYAYDTIPLDFDNNNAVVDRLIWLYFEIAKDCDDPDLEAHATEQGDALALAYGAELEANIACVHARNALWQTQSTYSDEVIYLLHTLSKATELGRADSLSFADLRDRLGEALTAHLTSYEIHSPEDVKDLHELFSTLLEYEDGELLSDSRLGEIGLCNARLLQQVSCREMAYFEQVVPYAELLLKMLPARERVSLTEAVDRAVRECEPGDAYALRDYLQWVDELLDEELISEKSAVLGLSRQKRLIKAGLKDNTLDGFYETVAICSMLDDFMTDRDKASLSRDILSQARATYRALSASKTATYRDEDDFFQYASYLVELGYITEDQLYALMPSESQSSYR